MTANCAVSMTTVPYLAFLHSIFDDAAVGVKQFIWGTSGAPVEAHDTKIFEDDGDRSWKSARARAFVGLSDMWASVRHIDTLPVAVEESQTTIDKFWQLVAVVLGAAIAGGAAKAVLLALLNSGESTSWLTSIINIVFYPLVIPAVLVGLYLRVLMQRGKEQARDFTAAEAQENWIKVAPHSAELGVFGRTSGVTTSFIICVWMLLPIAHSHDVDTLFKSALESGITAAVSIFTIKLSLYLTNMLTDVVLGLVAGLLPFEFPKGLQELISSIVNFGAEVFFVAVLLGYAWSRTREQFMRL